MGSIRFPHLGFEVLAGKSFTIFGFEIAFYGIIIAVGMILSALLVYHEAKRTGQNVDNYIDYTIFGIIAAIIGARIYYVAFEWDYYSQNISQIFNLRKGGLAIYGAIIGAVIALAIYSKVKKVRFLQFLDTMVLGLVLGQAIGRWGNFFNREAYGCFTDNLFAMQIPVADATVVNESMLVSVNGAQYVQVHPTFLYESFFNLILLIILLVFKDKKKFYGENTCRYLMGYGIIRFFIEGLRTDQLQLHGVAVSQVLSAVLFAAGLGITVFMRVRLIGKDSLIDPIPDKKAKDKAVLFEDKEYEEEENDDIDITEIKDDDNDMEEK